MRKSVIPRIFGALAALAAVACDPPAAKTAETRPDAAGKETTLAHVASENNRFALELYQKLRVGNGNILASPYGISTAFALAYPAARGKTAAELARAFHFGACDADTFTALGALFKTINDAGKDGSFQLSTANALWGQEGVALLPDYLKTVEDHFGAGLRRVDFKSNPEAARLVINQWIEAQTRDKIKDLLKKGDLNQATRLVLTNAVYMKAAWAEPFNKPLTHDEPFHLTLETKPTVPTMHRTGDYNYYEGGSFAAVEIPYALHALSMIVILPTIKPTSTTSGYAALANTENALTLDWLPKLRGSKVELALPRFKFENRFALKSTLAALGVVDAFQYNDADFSGMTGRKDFWIDEAVHQTYIDCNEEGTEAAAATAIMMRSAAMMVPKPPIPFHADHPFLFLIRENTTGCILFIGRVVNPRG